MGLSCQAQGFHSSVAVKCSPTPTRMLMLPGFGELFFSSAGWSSMISLGSHKSMLCHRSVCHLGDHRLETG